MAKTSDQRKTKAQLIGEVVELRRRVAELEAPGTKPKWADGTPAESGEKSKSLQLESLQDVGLGLAAELHLNGLLDSIVSQAIELVGGASGGLYLYRPGGDVLELAHALGSDLAPIGSILPPGT